MGNPKFEIYKATNDEFRYRLKAGNGEIILSGEGYKSKQGCETGIQSVKLNAPIDSRYELRSSTRNEPYFVLKAANNEIVGVSEMYSSSQARDTGIAAVNRDAPTASIVDLT